MTNFEAGKKLLEEARIYLEEVERAYAQGFWNISVRRAQEVVELSLKGILKIIGIEYPKIHDPSGFLMRMLSRRGITLDESIKVQVEAVSKELAEKRGPAFYFEREFGEADAVRAKEGAKFVFEFAKGLQKRVEGETGEK